MAQYIDKDAVVAEIKKRIDAALFRQRTLEAIGRETIVNEMVANELTKVLKFINTLEVKEVDSLTPEEIKKICTIYDNLNQERKCATILYNSDETFFNDILMEYKLIAQKGE